MTMISSTPSSMMATSRERITLPKGLVTTPPAFLMIFTSPFRRPSAAGRSSTSRVSIQVKMAIFLLGYLLAAYCSYRFSSTNFRLYASSSSIIAAFSFHRTGVYWITASSSVASSLKITGRNPSLQLQMATPGRPIQSP